MNSPCRWARKTTPESDDAAHASVDAILARQPGALYLTHYAQVRDVERLGADMPLLAVGWLATAVFMCGAVAQIVVGRLIDTMPFKPLQLWMSVAQIPLLIFAAHAQAWWLFVALLAVMMFVFGSIPFTDAMIVRYVDDRLRSRVAGMRLTVAFGISSFAVWLLGPLVKSIGFTHALWIMAAIAAIRSAIVLLLPDEPPVEQKAPA